MYEESEYILSCEVKKIKKIYVIVYEDENIEIVLYATSKKEEVEKIKEEMKEKFKEEIKKYGGKVRIKICYLNKDYIGEMLKYI